MQYKDQLREIIQNESWLMRALSTARELGLPDWFIAGGAIRNTVWAVLHGFDKRNCSDIDVVYCDNSDLSSKKDTALEQQLITLQPDYDWNVFNQARAFTKHDWMPRVVFSEESIAYWSETPTCVGARLEIDDALTICAPHGLDDLFNLVVQPVPHPYQNLELYRERLSEKQWQKRWPGLRVEGV